LNAAPRADHEISLFSDSLARRATRELGMDFFGGPDAICRKLGAAIVSHVGSHCYAHTAHTWATNLEISPPGGGDPSAWMRAAFRAHPCTIFAGLPAHKIEAGLGFDALREYRRQDVRGSNNPLGVKLYEILSVDDANPGCKIEPVLCAHEEDVWRSALQHTPLQSRRDPLGLNEFIALTALVEVKQRYQELSAKAVSLIR
jgi:hypothetical protein